MSLAEAATVLPRRNGKKVHVKTIKRWISKGARGIRLAGTCIGGIWYVTEEAIEEFVRACTLRSAPAAMQSPQATTRLHSEAKEQLKRRFGIHGESKATRKVPMRMRSASEATGT